MDHGQCGCHQRAPQQQSVHQTLDEMDFERSLCGAIALNDTSRVEKLLEHASVDVNQQDSAGYSPLHYATRQGHAETCRRLLAKGARRDARTAHGRATPLHRAAYAGHVAIVEMLLLGQDPLSCRALLAIQDVDGKTALHAAAEGNRREAYNTLVKFGADENLVAHSGRRAFELFKEI